ncbi:MAG: hypothetical protein KDD50_15865 [Bdellovibrionales bacterium]|nr:hypothetical protein [Bdellovibrionales bacterium]
MARVKYFYSNIHLYPERYNRVFLIVSLLLVISSVSFAQQCTFDLDLIRFYSLGQSKNYTLKYDPNAVVFKNEKEVKKSTQLKQKTSHIRVAIQTLTQGERKLDDAPLLYPASGTDSYTGFLLGAQKIIALDNNPFWDTLPVDKTLNIKIKDTLTDRKETFRHYKEIEESGSVGERIIGNLIAHLGPITIQQVDIIVSKEKINRRLYQLDDQTAQPAIHGRILFMTADGVQREYIHINGNAIGRNVQNMKWFQYVKDSGFEHLLIKGSNGGIFQPGGIHNTSALRKLILEKLKDRKGLLIEGHTEENDIYGGWELTNGEYRSYPDFIIYPKIRQHNFTVFNDFRERPILSEGYFGYNVGVRVIYFNK